MVSALDVFAAATRAPFWRELLHPLRYWGYQFWSGVGSDLGEVTLVTGMAITMLTAYRHIECHQEGCHRLGRFHHGHLKLCHVHHPLTPDDGRIRAEHIEAVRPDRLRSIN